MGKPVIIAVDDDHIVQSAVERDLRGRYSKDYRILGATSGAAAVEILKKLKLRDSPVALILADQRMPQMSGVEFLAHAAQLFPTTKRILLTAYADTDVAIRAINEIRLDHYLLKPWDPPEEHLYPVIDDQLSTWAADYHPGFEGIRVIGHRWSSQAHAIKDFLARNLIPYHWLDIESDPVARQLLEAASADLRTLPVVIFPDSTVLVQPTLGQLGTRAGLSARPQAPFYDLVIVGSGPGGLGAGVYAASEGLRTLIIEREAPGGQAGQSSLIENYLGFPAGLSGGELARRAVAQAKRFGAELLTPQDATRLTLHDPYKIVTLVDGTEVSCHALLIATGVSYRRLEAPGCEELVGAGVYYGAAITEAVAMTGQDVFVVGGGNSAGQAAIYLAGFARHVTILVRGHLLAESMSRYLVDQIEKTANISICTRARVAAAHGTGNLEAITIDNVDSGAADTQAARGLFIFIGALPRTEWLGGLLELDSSGFILTGPDLAPPGRRPRGWTLERDPYWLESSVPGIFVAGDVRTRSIKRVASAVGEGAMAVQFVHQYLAAR